ncbi:MAG: DUF5689 domain-containing protein [Rikenellaceae bacterium]
MGRVIIYTLQIVAVAFLSGCYDSFGGGGELTSSDIPTSNITIRELADMVVTEKMLIYDDIVIQGVVTSTDRNGNFYKTFVVESGGYGVEILEGAYDSYVTHDVGRVVSVKLKGLALSRYMGVLQVGLEASAGSYYTLDYLSAQQIIDKYIYCGDSDVDVVPYDIEYADLTEEMCGRLVRIGSLTHLPSDDDVQPYMWGGYQQFVDNDDNSIYCYTSDYANFSLLEIPSSEVSLCGVLQWGEISGVSGGEKYILEMRGVEDCE